MNLAKKLLIAATLTMIGGVASAATVAMTTAPAGAGALISVGDIVSTPNPVGFTPPSDDWYFSVSTPGVVSLFLTAYSGVTNLIGDLSMCGDASCSTEGSAFASVLTGGVTSVSLGVGLYHLVISGDAAANYVAFASLGAPAPVPLPAAAWLLVSGLAGLGAMARRRKAEAA